MAVDFGVWRQRLASLDDPLFYKDPYALASCLLLDEGGVAGLAGGSRPCTDDRNFIEYFDPSAKDPANWERNVALASAASGAPASVFSGVEDSLLLGRYREGQRIFLEALTAQNRGDIRGMIEAMGEAVRTVPENEDLRFLLEQEAVRYRR
jgi:hypothetical protein